MSLSVGIIGLPNVGKSTLFNALLGRQQALTAPYPFATIEPNIGVVDVPDERLEKLHVALSKNPRSDVTADTPIVYSSIRFVDIAGLVKGAAEGQGLGNAFLSHIRDVDVILHVVRDFDPSTDSGQGQAIPRAPDSKDPAHDVAIVETELALKDLETTERAEQKSGQEQPVELLATKPTIYVVNVDEKKIAGVAQAGTPPSARRESSSEDVGRGAAKRQDPVNSVFRGKPSIFVCAKIEEEISRLSKNEQKEFLSAYDLRTSSLDRIITECYRLLGLISFFTAGKIEVRAWPLPEGSPAVRASAVIHSDFARLFIRAEVIGWNQLASAGSWQDAKEEGKVRTEGRDYVVQDGDVANFLIGK